MPDRRAEISANMLPLFREAALRVPAYAQFLRAHGARVDEGTTLDDLARLPLTTKENYVRAFPIAERVWDGALERSAIFAVSSGSSGEPTFWPRTHADELAVADRFQQVLVDGFEADRRRTLCVVCFPMGTWVGGVYTLACLRHLVDRGIALTILAPGNQKAEILRVLPLLAPAFDQVVLFGYPPFLKEVLDGAKAAGVELGARALRLVLAGEVVTESWRELMHARHGLGPLHRGIASLYGTADGGVLGVETPLATAVRRLAHQDRALARDLFGEARLPTLAQYDPCARYFEVEGRTLLFSGRSHAPLLRYHIADSGGLIDFDSLRVILADHGHAYAELLAGLEGAPTREMPFVYVFGRELFAVSLYGANVYPENISPALEGASIAPHVTGKLVLEIAHDDDANPHLAITVELAAGVRPEAALAEGIAAAIEGELRARNSEYAAYVPAGKQRPRVALRPEGDLVYFPPGVKHRYTRPGGRGSLPG